MTHREMIAAAKSELEAQPATIASFLGIDVEIAKASWLKAIKSDYKRLALSYNGLPKTAIIPLEETAGFIAMGEILRENGIDSNKWGDF